MLWSRAHPHRRGCDPAASAEVRRAPPHSYHRQVGYFGISQLIVEGFDNIIDKREHWLPKLLNHPDFISARLLNHEYDQIQNYEQDQLINNIDKQQKFNHYINNLFDKIKDYIVAHYKLNSRHDSQYWIDNRENSNISDTLASLLATWDQTEGDFEAALKEHQSELVYFSPSWYCLLAGKGRFPEQLSPTPSNIKVAPEQEIIKFCQTISQYFLSHQEQLSKLYGAKWPKS